MSGQPKGAPKITGTNGPIRARFEATWRFMAGFAAETRGGIAIEFVLWVPVFVGLLMLFVDTSLTFMNLSNFWNVSRETARIVARHGFDAQAAQNFAEAHARVGQYTPKAEVTIDGATVTVTITGNLRKMSVFGVLDFVPGQKFAVRVTDVMEPI